MNKIELVAYHKQVCDEMQETLRRKNHDYTGAGDDPFKNFRNTNFAGGASALQGFLFRMSDKMARIISFVEQGVLLVQDESIHDTCKDLANYAILCDAFILEMKVQSKRSDVMKADDEFYP